MKFGIMPVLQGHPEGDHQVYMNEARLAVAAEAMGYDIVWAPEHHFFDYSMQPDNMMFLTHVAAKTKKIQIGPAAVIVPWNDPLRVIERMSVLDHLSEGRAVLGLGRGLARREYDAFRIPMDESRGRFNEGAEMIIRGLETGFIEGNGQYYKQPRVECRPRPLGTFRDRQYAVCISPESFDIAAELNCAALMFTQRPWDAHVENIKNYRKKFKALNHTEAKPISIVDFAVIMADARKAEEIARDRLGAYLLDVLTHYELLEEEHFAKTGAYDQYAEAARAMNEMGKGAVLQGYLDALAWGDPARVIDKLEERRALIGDFDIIWSFNFAQLPYEIAEEGMRLFIEKVAPRLEHWH